MRIRIRKEKQMNSAELAVAPATSAANQSSWKDMVGIVASIGCAIHCAAMPFVIAYLPAWGLTFLADEAFHKWMALVCFLIAIAAFLPGLRTHGNWWPVGIGSAGLVLITFAAFGLAGECCPSCAAADAPSAVAIAGTTNDAAEETCEHCEHCEHRAEEHPHTLASHDTVVSTDAAVTSTTAPDEEKDLLALLAPWITPFGGLLLVSAHLLNRQCGCVCDCCAPEESVS